MSEIEGPYPLPDGWVWTTLGEVAEVNPRRRVPTEVTPESLVTFLPMQAVDAVSGTIATPEDRPLTEVSRGFTYFSENDVLFAKITPSMENGKAAIARGLTNGVGFGSTEFHVLRASEVVSPEWLFHFIRQRSFRSDAKANFSGTAGQLRVPSTFMQDYPLPLAPLPEQRRIVDEIETQFSRLDAAEAALKRVQANLKRYRASVLKAACEGRLVPIEAELARVEGRGHEPASVLLERILAERRAKWHAANPKKAYKEPVGPNVEELPGLPEGWVWATVEQVAEIGGGITKHHKRNELALKMPYLRVANVYANELRLDEIAEIGIEPNEAGRALLEKGDLLVVEGNGSIEQVGRVAVWDGSIAPCLHQNHLIRARFLNAGMTQFALFWLLSLDGRAQIERVASSTSGLHTLSISKVGQLPIPLPPLGEMERITEEVRSALDNGQALASSVDVGLRRCRGLRQSLLRSMFRGIRK